MLFGDDLDPVQTLESVTIVLPPNTDYPTATIYRGHVIDVLRGPNRQAIYIDRKTVKYIRVEVVECADELDAMDVCDVLPGESIMNSYALPELQQPVNRLTLVEPPR